MVESGSADQVMIKQESHKYSDFIIKYEEKKKFFFSQVPGGVF